nr:uncharacterized protein LOC112795128 [Arachis hypogaea]
MVKAIDNMASHLSLYDQGTPIIFCGEEIKEHRERVNLELQDEEEELRQEVQQEEEAETIEQEEGMVEDLGDVMSKEESQVEEPSSIEFESDVKEDSAQPTRHNVIEKMEEMGQVLSSPIYDDSTSTGDPFELNDSFSH